MMDGGDGAEQEFNYSLYINPNLDEVKDCGEIKREVPPVLLEETIRATNPLGPWRVTKTACGLLATFTFEADAIALLNIPLQEALDGPVQVARFSSKDSKQKQSLLLRDVPWAVPLQEIRNVLEHQGIFPLSVERLRQNVKIELTDHVQYENLLRYGLDFLGATRFLAVPDRWRNNLLNRPNGIIEQIQQEPIIQCYRCQGFWHIAANCHEMMRCVRCGGQHSVEDCRRPRHEPVCCHCSGPHHAAYRHCPVRMQLSTASIALAKPFASR
uniref:Nucleic-acid-binding protein from transposon X-element n=1 Tax=Lygus hesperus TaxID=30085 RepID=A0A0A9X276_LYGHE